MKKGRTGSLVFRVAALLLTLHLLANVAQCFQPSFSSHLISTWSATGHDKLHFSPQRCGTHSTSVFHFIGRQSSLRQSFDLTRSCKRAAILNSRASDSVEQGRRDSLPPRHVGGGGFPCTPHGDWRQHVAVLGKPVGYLPSLEAIVLSDKRSRMRGFFALELARAAGLREVEWGLWAGAPLSKRELQRLASARAQLHPLTPLCASGEELLACVSELALCVTGTRWLLHHERLAKLPPPPSASTTTPSDQSTSSSTESLDAVQLACCLSQLIAGTPSLTESETGVRLVVVESGAGVLLAVADWSRQDHPYPSFRGEAKPFTFNAAVDPDLAQVALNLCTAAPRAPAAPAASSSSASSSSSSDSSTALADATAEGGRGPEWVVLNPCVGSGTVAFTAMEGVVNGHCAAVLGLDLNPRCLHGSKENLDYFQVPAQLLPPSLPPSSSASSSRVIELPSERADGARRGVWLAEHDVREELQIRRGGARVEIDAVVAALPFGINYRLKTPEDLPRMLSALAASAPKAMMCFVSGVNIEEEAEAAGLEVEACEGSWNGKRFVSYLTLVRKKTA